MKKFIKMNSSDNHLSLGNLCRTIKEISNNKVFASQTEIFCTIFNIDDISDSTVNNYCIGYRSIGSDYKDIYYNFKKKMQNDDFILIDITLNIISILDGNIYTNDNNIETLKLINSNSNFQKLINSLYNIAKNDNTKIIMARDNDKYYYQISGSTDMIIIQKNGFKYTLDPRMVTYFKESAATVEDYSLGILPRDMNELKTRGYETGKEEILDQKLRYERYNYDVYTSTYYFKGNDLIYVKEVTPLKTVVMKYNDYKTKVKDSLFKIPKKYMEMTY